MFWVFKVDYIWILKIILGHLESLQPHFESHPVQFKATEVQINVHLSKSETVTRKYLSIGTNNGWWEIVHKSPISPILTGGLPLEGSVRFLAPCHHAAIVPPIVIYYRSIALASVLLCLCMYLASTIAVSTMSILHFCKNVKRESDNSVWLEENSLTFTSKGFIENIFQQISPVLCSVITIQCVHFTPLHGCI